MTLATYLFIMVFSLAVIVAANYYIPKRLSSLLGIQRARWYILAFTTLTLTGTFSMGAIGHADNTLLLTALKVGTLWLGLGFYLLLFLLLYELAGRVIPLSKKAAGLSVITLSIAVMLYGIWNARDYTVQELEIPISGLSREVTLFHIPDIHLGPFRGKETLQSVVDDIARLKPDIVLINGDLVDGREGLTTDTLSLLQKIQPPVYFTGGNHDSYVGIDEVRQLVTKYGVQVLDNEVIHTHGIQLVGLDYMNADEEVYDAHASERTETIKSVLPTLSIDKAAPSVFVHHSPAGIQYMSEAGADLILTGHTHAGQLFPATLIAQFQFPYLQGLYQINDTVLYVSQGVGTFGPPMRVATKGEATLIRLVAGRRK